MSSMPADAESSVKERKPRQMSRTDSEASSTTSRDSSASLHNHHNDPFLRPHLIPQKRFRTLSTCERTLPDRVRGKIIEFCRVKGFGFIRCNPEEHITLQGFSHDDTVFVHISDIQDTFVPLVEDEVVFKLCPIPPKFVKFQAVDVHLQNIDINVHKKWSEPFDPVDDSGDTSRTPVAMATSPVREPIRSSID
ncbi:cold shock domain-containing protein CG9705-like [Convolutriloba macropyga]|uniref:cold shock domain-containing protein CG9705-like n=1 Tax=Convolutriloba macropyga TaxID=536237 RepID=UPI003F523E43